MLIILLEFVLALRDLALQHLKLTIVAKPAGDGVVHPT